MKKIWILILLLLALVGCSKTNNVDITESTQGDSWVKLEQSAGLLSSSSNESNKDGINYVRNDYKFSPLCEEDNILNIEYYLENGTGTFMDKNRLSGYSDGVKSEAYLLDGNNQEDIYFSVYFVFENNKNLSNDQKIQQASQVLEKLRIKLTITYQDGSVKVRQIGIKLTSTYNFKNLDFYEITTP